jgi:hypothetical protein
MIPGCNKTIKELRDKNITKYITETLQSDCGAYAELLL